MSFGKMEIRGGNRGGRDAFDWKEVKDDKHRCAARRAPRMPRAHERVAGSQGELSRSLAQRFGRPVAEGEGSDVVREGAQG